jgi:hypothetical protein
MLAGVSYEEAEAALPVLELLPDEPLIFRLVSEMLRALGWRPGRHLHGGAVSLIWAVRTVKPDEPCLLQVSDWPTLEDGTWNTTTHAVVLADGMIHDPSEYGPCTVWQYAKLDYWVREILEREGAQSGARRA